MTQTRTSRDVLNRIEDDRFNGKYMTASLQANEDVTWLLDYVRTLLDERDALRACVVNVMHTLTTDFDADPRREALADICPVLGLDMQTLAIDNAPVDITLSGAEMATILEALWKWKGTVYHGLLTDDAVDRLRERLLQWDATKRVALTAAMPVPDEPQREEG